jgi:cellulose biosynthesis protein BcsQ
MLEQCLVICNGKGGVGKSSIASALAANAAATGRRTLLIDLDPLGSLDQDLGYRQTGESDDGRGLYRAVVDGEPLTPLVDVRTDLDVVAAGDFTQAVYCRVANRERQAAEVVAPLEALGAEYDLVIIDTPPASRVAIDVAFCVARFMVMPVGVDTGSLDGLELVSDRYHVTRSRGLNPALEPLGVVLFAMDPAQPRLHREVRTDVEWELDGAAPVLDTFIRYRPRAARDLRRHGLVAGEYLRAARDARDDLERIPGADSFDEDAVGLAEDYWDLADDVLQRLSARAVLPAAESPAAASVPHGSTPSGAGVEVGVG